MKLKIVNLTLLVFFISTSCSKKDASKSSASLLTDIASSDPNIASEVKDGISNIVKQTIMENEKQISTQEADGSLIKADIVDYMAKQAAVDQRQDEDIETNKEAIQEHEERLSNIEEKILELEAFDQSVTENIALIEKDIQDLKEEQEAAKARDENIESTLKSNYSALSNKMGDLKTEIERGTQSKIDELASEIAGNVAEITSLRDTVAKNDANVRSLINEKARLQEKLMDARVNALSTSVQEQFSHQTLAIAGIKDELLQVNGKIANLSNELKLQEAELDSSRKYYATLLDDAINVSAREREKLQAQMNEEKRKISQLENEIKTTNSNLSNLEDQAVAQRKDAEKKRFELETWTKTQFVKQNAQTNQEIQRLESEVNSLDDKLENTSNALGSMISSVERNTKSMIDQVVLEKNADIAALETKMNAKFNDFSAKIVAFQKEYAKLFEKIESELNENKKKFEELQASTAQELASLKKADQAASTQLQLVQNVNAANWREMVAKQLQLEHDLIKQTSEFAKKNREMILTNKKLFDVLNGKLDIVEAKANEAFANTLENRHAIANNAAKIEKNKVLVEGLFAKNEELSKRIYANEDKISELEEKNEKAAAEVQEKLDALNSKVFSLEKEGQKVSQELQAQQDALKTQLTHIETENKEREQEIATLKQENEAQNTKINQNKSNIGSLSTEMEEGFKKVSEKSDANLVNAISALAKQNKDNIDALTNIVSTQGEELKELGGKISAVESQVDTINQQLVEMENQIYDIVQRLDDAEIHEKLQTYCGNVYLSAAPYLESNSPSNLANINRDLFGARAAYGYGNLYNRYRRYAKAEKIFDYYYFNVQRIQYTNAMTLFIQQICGGPLRNLPFYTDLKKSEASSNPGPKQVVGKTVTELSAETYSISSLLEIKKIFSLVFDQTQKNSLAKYLDNMMKVYKEKIEGTMGQRIISRKGAAQGVVKSDLQMAFFELIKNARVIRDANLKLLRNEIQLSVRNTMLANKVTLAQCGYGANTGYRSGNAGIFRSTKDITPTDLKAIQYYSDEGSDIHLPSQYTYFKNSNGSIGIYFYRHDGIRMYGAKDNTDKNYSDSARISANDATQLINSAEKLTTFASSYFAKEKNYRNSKHIVTNNIDTYCQGRNSYYWIRRGLPSQISYVGIKRRARVTYHRSNHCVRAIVDCYPIAFNPLDDSRTDTTSFLGKENAPMASGKTLETKRFDLGNYEKEGGAVSGDKKMFHVIEPYEKGLMAKNNLKPEDYCADRGVPADVSSRTYYSWGKKLISPMKDPHGSQNVFFKSSGSKPAIFIARGCNTCSSYSVSDALAAESVSPPVVPAGKIWTQESQNEFKALIAKVAGKKIRSSSTLALPTLAPKYGNKESYSCVTQESNCKQTCNFYGRTDGKITYNKTRINRTGNRSGRDFMLDYTAMRKNDTCTCSGSLKDYTPVFEDKEL